MTKWDLRWMELAKLVAGWSKDKSRKCGAVIIGENETVIALGWNGFPRKIDDNIELRHKRPAKYLYTEHAERNAIFNASCTGSKTLGCRMYIPWFPCADCARAIIQAGIKEIICYRPDESDITYSDSFAASNEMLLEADVMIRFLVGESPVRK